MSVSSLPPADIQGIDCRVFTFAGWVSGALRAPSTALLVDFLNRNDPLLRLTGATLPGQRARHPFFVLERTAVIAVVPVDQTRPVVQPIHSARRFTRHPTSWLLPGGGIIEGALDVLEGVHIDEHLVHRTNFVALHDCSLFLPDGAGGVIAEPGVSVVALQTNRAVGVTEIT